jgi:hypothetical protein
MTIRRPAPALILMCGLALGWIGASGRGPQVRAGDPRLGPKGEASSASRCLAMSGPVLLMKHPSLNNAAVPLEAVYYLDYEGARLLAAVPTFKLDPAGPGSKPVANGNRLATEFAERDLLADFQIRPGVDPQFHMTVCRLGSNDLGWAPLYVFESTTGQMATYRVTPQSVGTSSKPKFELLDRRPLPASSLPAANH